MYNVTCLYSVLFLSTFYDMQFPFILVLISVGLVDTYEI